MQDIDQSTTPYSRVSMITIPHSFFFYNEEKRKLHLERGYKKVDEILLENDKDKYFARVYVERSCTVKFALCVSFLFTIIYFLFYLFF